MTLEEYLARLNPEQLEAASYHGGLAAISGTPGSGKTATIVGLCANLVHRGLAPDNLLAMTFTRTAANEMNQRLLSMGVTARVGTIHSVALQILTGAAKTLLDSMRLDEGWIFERELRQTLRDLRKVKKIPARGVNFAEVSSFIARCKLEGAVYTHGDLWGLSSRGEEAIGMLARAWQEKTGLSCHEALLVFEEAERRRAAKGIYSFDDMLNWAWAVLVTDSRMREFWQQRYPAVIIDEVQDSGRVQWDIARLISGLGSIGRGVEVERSDPHPNLVVAGEISQSIYAFNGGMPKLMLDYCKQPDVKVYKLVKNYRSGSRICKVGSCIVVDKSWHISGEMEPMRDVEGELRLRRCQSAEEEAVDAINQCQEHIAGGGKASDCTVLSRLASGLYLAELECIRRRLPYIKRASGAFFESKEVLDMLAYIRVAACADPEGKALRRAVNTPFRFIGTSSLNRASDRARETGESILDWLRKDVDLSYRQKRSMDDLYELLCRLNKMVVAGEKLAVKRAERLARAAEAIAMGRDTSPGPGEDEPEDEPIGPGSIIAEVLRVTDYLEEMKRDEGLHQGDDSRTAVIHGLQRIAEQFLSTIEFLKYIDWLTVAVKQGRAQLKRNDRDDGETVDAIVLSTVHRAKGLEYRNTFIVDVNGGRFPCSRAEDLDEELRLLYVAVTRGKDLVQVSYSDAGDSIFIQKLKAISDQNPGVVTSNEDH